MLICYNLYESPNHRQFNGSLSKYSLSMLLSWTFFPKSIPQNVCIHFSVLSDKCDMLLCFWCCSLSVCSWLWLHGCILLNVFLKLFSCCCKLSAHRWCYLVTIIISSPPTHTTNKPMNNVYINVLVGCVCVCACVCGGRKWLSLNNTTCGSANTYRF